LNSDTIELIAGCKVKVTVDAWRCERCEHTWVPRDWDTEPRVCPKCKSPYWNKPRRRPKVSSN